jgi:hypothetical protein
MPSSLSFDLFWLNLGNLFEFSASATVGMAKALV